MYAHRHATGGWNLKRIITRLGVGVGFALVAALIVVWQRLRNCLANTKAEARAVTERFADLIEGIDAVVWQLDPVTERFNFVNEQRTGALLGHPHRWWMEGGLDFFLSIVHPDDRERMAATARETIEHMQSRDVKYRAIAQDGRVIWMRSLVRPSPSGNHLCGISIDITEQQRAEEALIASNHRFRGIFDQAAVGIVEVSLDGHAQLANQRFCTMLGYSQPELVGKHFGELTHPDDLPADLRQADRLMRGEIDSYTMEKRFLRRDGQPVWTNLTCSAVRQPHERPSAVVAIIIDITAQKEAETRLRRLTETLEEHIASRTAELRQTTWELTRSEQRERQRIAADLHDELAQLLLATRFKLDSVTSTDSKVQARIQEASNLVEKSMKYTRSLISTLGAAAREELPLHEALRQEAKRIDKTYDLTIYVEAEELPRMLSVELRDLLLRAAHELLINAAKHARASEARLSLWRTGEYLCLQVRDQGIGFDPARLEQEKAPETGGFGLRHLQRRLRLMDGDVKLHSKPGEGTEVTLYLPLGEQVA